MLRKKFKIFSVFWLIVFLVILMGLVWLGSNLNVSASSDTTPPQISDIKVSEISSSSTIIYWKTDEETDSMVNYGLNKDCGIARDSTRTESHSIFLQNLEPSTVYYFRIVASDAAGNKSISNSYHFTTKSLVENIKGIENVKSEKEKALVEKAYSEIKQINQSEALAILAGEIQEKAKEVIQAPDIIGEKPEIEIGTDYAIISWKTSKKSNSIVSLVPESDYNPDLDNPYTLNVGQPEEKVFDHSVKVYGLKPGIIYHFQISSKPDLGPIAKSNDMTFKTKPILPKVYNFRVVKVQEESATLAWDTSVPCMSSVQYTNLRTSKIKSQGDPNFLTNHTLQLTGLKFGVPYSALVVVEDENGQKAKSRKINFVTTKDKVPPKISKIHTDSALYPGSENKIQTIISWETDEPAMCQLFYQEGLAGGAKIYKFHKEVGYVKKHVRVSTNFSPSTVYKFWITCQDKVGNKSRSEDISLLTPQQQKSILDIIIGNFESTFGWMKNLKIGG